MDDSHSSPPVTFFRRMQSLAKLFRFVELCVLLALLPWISTRLPFAVRLSGEYCLRFAGIVLSPASIFLVGNAIVVTLLAKSGMFSPGNSCSVDNAVGKLFDKIRFEIRDGEIALISEDQEEIVYQDKEMISEELNTKITVPILNSNGNEEENAGEAFPEVKASYRRSQSENLRICNNTEEMNTDEKKLRRSETDISRKDLIGDERFPEEDNVSKEEFQKTIEDFIARQLSFHREERLAVVLHGQTRF